MSCHRVLIATGIYPPDIGGPATYARSLVDGLRGHGIEPVLLNFSPLLTRPWGFRHLIYLRLMLGRCAGADVVLALDPVSVGVPALLATRILRVPLVLRVGGDYAWEQGTERFGVEEGLGEFLASTYGWQIELLRKIESRVARAAVKVIVPSRFMRSVVQEWGVPTDRIAVVENAFNGAEAVNLPPTREGAKAKLGVDGHLVVSMGRLLRRKGFGVLIETIDRMRPEFPDIRLAILGSGPQSTELAKMVQDAQLECTVELLGAVPRTEALLYLKAADLFVLNSSGEGMANVIVEAMALGTPVAAASSGGNAELIDHGANGWLFTHNDVRELEAAIGKLLREPELALSLATAASQALDRFDMAQMVGGTIAVLDMALSNR